MIVKELKETIANLPDNMEVIVQKDVEGNGYSPLRGADFDAVYIPETAYYGEVYDTKWSADEADMNDEEWKEIKEKPRSLILHPIN